MPWRCPACQEQIRHEHEIQPSLGVVYRCHVCRLEVTFDPIAGRFAVPGLFVAEQPPRLDARVTGTKRGTIKLRRRNGRKK
jgi:hypothetical protein